MYHTSSAPVACSFNVLDLLENSLASSRLQEVPEAVSWKHRPPSLQWHW
ncbi:hypothetical protein [Mastigocladopsis repens]|nr:hypothetical protein [Mastigocladopsis repens]